MWSTHTRRRFHQHFTYAFLNESELQIFYLITIWLGDFWAKGYWQKSAHNVDEIEYRHHIHQPFTRTFFPNILYPKITKPKCNREKLGKTHSQNVDEIDLRCLQRTYIKKIIQVMYRLLSHILFLQRILQ